jgi:hypothetical protein
MAKPRKLLCYSDAPYVESLMALIETQSKPTIINWCVDYAEAHYLPIWEKHAPGDRQPHAVLEAALRAVALEDEQNSARCKWSDMNNIQEMGENRQARKRRKA